MHKGRVAALRPLFMIILLLAALAPIVLPAAPASSQGPPGETAPVVTPGATAGETPGAAPGIAPSPSSSPAASPSATPAPPPEHAGEAVALVIRYFEALKRLDYPAAVECLEGFGDVKQKAAALQDFMKLYPSKERRSLMQCEENLAQVSGAVERYYLSHQGKAPRALKETLSKEMYDIPSCPSAGRDSYSESFKASMKPFAYTLFCSGENHRGAFLGKNAPSYTTRDGLVTRRIWKFPEDCRWKLESFQILSVLRAGGMFQVQVREKSLLHEDAPTVGNSEFYVARLAGGYRILILPTLGKLEPEKKDLDSYMKLLRFSRAIVFFCNWMERPDFWKERAERNLIGCASNLKSLGDAIESYALDHGALPKSLRALIPNYVRFLPLCPAVDRSTYRAGYLVNHRRKSYVLYCRGHNHLDSETRANFPRLDSERGLLLH